MTSIKHLWKTLLGFFSDEDNANEPIYDPVHLAAMVVIVIFSVGALFWLLWTLLVFEGGFFAKVMPALQVLFTGKTLSDFGWVGYPYEMGIFEGFIGNSIAFILTIALIWGIWWVLFKGKKFHGS
ncbi:MAG: hypothetical protein A2901_01905 [Elusimicrobia bacterium RIFCSPLOWO2_01_FULL_54_10]|nr:MAG: hypothetical protein A2901_01905 [Elusimicrobia bacterium RIFCSPLOWO2_01_FULL_54_10]